MGDLDAAGETMRLYTLRFDEAATATCIIRLNGKKRGVK